MGKASVTEVDNINVHAWFLFAVVIKSLALHLHDAKLLGGLPSILLFGAWEEEEGEERRKGERREGHELQTCLRRFF